MVVTNLVRGPRARPWIWLVPIAAMAWLGVGCPALNQKNIKQAEIEYDLGVNDLKAGRVREAMNCFMQAVDLHPDFAQAHNGLGLAKHFLGQNEGALVHLEKALELKPEYSEVLNNMARVYISLGRFREAIPLLEKALEDVFLRERYLTESNLGWALFQIGKEDAGMKHVTNALAQNETYCVGYEYLGLMHQKRKAYKKAVRELEQLVVHCPRYASGHLNLGKVLLMDGKLDEGCKHLDLCLAMGRMTPVGQECDRLFLASCPGGSRRATP